jgi:hypothetical protein
MFNLFVSHETPLPEDLQPGVKARLISCNDRCAENCALNDYVDVTGCTERECSEICSGFVSFLMDLASKDDTLKFPYYMIVRHNYVSLYVVVIGHSEWLV